MLLKVTSETADSPSAVILSRYRPTGRLPGGVAWISVEEMRVKPAAGRSP